MTCRAVASDLSLGVRGDKAVKLQKLFVIIWKVYHEASAALRGCAALAPREIQDTEREKKKSLQTLIPLWCGSKNKSEHNV